MDKYVSKNRAFNTFIILLTLFLSKAFAETKYDRDYYNYVKIGDYSVHLSKDDKGNINVENDISKVRKVCPLENWTDDLPKGAGRISLTSDKLGLLLSGDNVYLKVKDIVACDGQPLTLYQVPTGNGTSSIIGTVVDINFSNKLYLSIIYLDGRVPWFRAQFSYFNSDKNIISAKGFWIEDEDWDVNDLNSQNSFDTPYYGNRYIGKISVNGQYVSPDYLGCKLDDIPGVWDVKQKKKVVFENTPNGMNIDEKCQALFAGKETLQDLGGKLVVPSNFVNE